MSAGTITNGVGDYRITSKSRRCKECQAAICVDDNRSIVRISLNNRQSIPIAITIIGKRLNGERRIGQRLRGVVVGCGGIVHRYRRDYRIWISDDINNNNGAGNAAGTIANGITDRSGTGKSFCGREGQCTIGIDRDNPVLRNGIGYIDCIAIGIPIIGQYIDRNRLPFICLRKIIFCDRRGIYRHRVARWQNCNRYYDRIRPAISVINDYNKAIVS